MMTESESRQIIQKYQRLLIGLARKAARQVQHLSSHDFDDFYTIGMRACIDAVQSFKPDGGCSAEASFVAIVVRRALRKEVAEARSRGFREAKDVPIFLSADELHAPDPADREKSRWLANHMSILTEAERRVVSAYLQGETGESIGATLGVSKQRIDQIKDKAIEKLQRSARLTFPHV
jgi:RNA polymerase sigma factor (sigma-70 family)